jgi:hypothetical protein
MLKLALMLGKLSVIVLFGLYACNEATYHGRQWAVMLLAFSVMVAFMIPNKKPKPKSTSDIRVTASVWQRPV